MASISEQLIGGVQQTTRDQGGDVGTAVQLGLKVEQSKQNRAKLEQAKLGLKHKSDEGLFKSIKRVNASKTAGERKFHMDDARVKFTQARPNADPKGLELMFVDEEYARAAEDAYFSGLDKNPDPDPERQRRTDELWAADPVTAKEEVLRIVDEQNKTKRQELLADQRVAKETRAVDRDKLKRFTTISGQLSKDVKSDFNDLDKQAGATRSAHDSLGDIVKGFEAGQDSSEMEVLFNASGRSIAKTFNSGAMTDRDVADFKELSGIEEISAKVIRTYVTGGVSEENAVQLFALTKRIAKRIDHEKSVKAARYKDRFTTPEFAGQEAELRKASGIDASLTPTLEFVPQKEKAFVLKDVSSITADKFNSYDEAKQKRFADKLKTTVEEIKRQLETK